MCFGVFITRPYFGAVLKDNYVAIEGISVLLDCVPQERITQILQIDVECRISINE